MAACTERRQLAVPVLLALSLAPAQVVRHQFVGTSGPGHETSSAISLPPPPPPHVAVPPPPPAQHVAVPPPPPAQHIAVLRARRCAVDEERKQACKTWRMKNMTPGRHHDCRSRAARAASALA